MARTIPPVVSALLRSMRPTQWSKNVFVFAPLVFAHLLTNHGALVQAGMAFAAFCAAASAIYLVNDIRDREEDRRHPLKRRRPIAAGELGVPAALVAAFVLGGGAIAIALQLGSLFAGLPGGYVAQSQY